MRAKKRKKRDCGEKNDPSSNNLFARIIDRELHSTMGKINTVSDIILGLFLLGFCAHDWIINLGIIAVAFKNVEALKYIDMTSSAKLGIYLLLFVSACFVLTGIWEMEFGKRFGKRHDD